MPTSGDVRFGSGDAFAAGYMYAYLGGPGYCRAQAELGATPLLFASAVTALKRCIPGDVASVTADEVFAALSGREARFR